MSDSIPTSRDARVLKWGGRSGILGSVMFILAMAFVMVFIGPEDPDTLVEWVERFPEIQRLRVVENFLYLAGLLFQIPLYLALFWSLKKDNLAPALFGCVIAVVGLIPMIASSTPHVAHAPLSEIYHSGVVTAEAQDAISVMWQGTWGLFNAPLYIGFTVVPIGIILFGVAMSGSPSYGGVLKWLSIVMGAVGLVGAVLQMIDHASPAGIVSYLCLIVFGFAAGGKLRRLSG